MRPPVRPRAIRLQQVQVLRPEEKSGRGSVGPQQRAQRDRARVATAREVEVEFILGESAAAAADAQARRAAGQLQRAEERRREEGGLVADTLIVFMHYYYSYYY